MQGDLEAIRAGIKVLYDARGEIESMVSAARKAVQVAANSNKNRKFKNAEEAILNMVGKMEDTGRNLINVSNNLSCIEKILKQLEEN